MLTGKLSVLASYIAFVQELEALVVRDAEDPAERVKYVV